MSKAIPILSRTTEMAEEIIIRASRIKIRHIGIKDCNLFDMFLRGKRRSHQILDRIEVQWNLHRRL